MGRVSSLFFADCDRAGYTSEDMNAREVIQCWAGYIQYRQGMRLVVRGAMGMAKYKVPYNINMEEHRTYLQKVERASQIVQQGDLKAQIPRRKRRIYDRPRIDDSIEGYGAWRVFEEEELIHKTEYEHSLPVALKLKLSPKWLIHAFGVGHVSLSNPKSAHREFYFQDNKFSSYLLYEYRNTTAYKPNVEGYDYENQQHVRPRERIAKRLDPVDFWNSEELFEFRVNTSLYADKFKFKRWLEERIQKSKQGKSYDQIIDEKYGKYFTFNKKEDAAKFEANTPMILNVVPEHFNPPKKGKIPEPKVRLWSKMDQKYRIKQRVSNIQGQPASSQQQTQKSSQ